MAAGLIFAVAIIIAAWPPASSPIEEGRDYLLIAQGHYHSAYYYYAGRILHPLAAHALVSIAHISFARAFQLLAAASLVLLVAALEVYLANYNPRAGWNAMPLLASPILIMNFRLDYFPDLFHSALCAVFFLLFQLNAWVSLPLLVLLYITRESTIFLVGVVVILSVRAGRPGVALGALFAGVVGMSVASAFVSAGLPNKHGLPTLIFDTFKILYNASRMLGFVFWTDTNAHVLGSPPMWSIPVHLGSIHRVGFYAFDFRYPLLVALQMVMAFGTMPVYLLTARPRLESLDLRIAAWYGMLCLFATPLIGNWTSRYILYAWPLFWLVAPVTMAAEMPAIAKVALASSVAASWLPVASPLLFGYLRMGQPGFESEVSEWTNLAVVLALEAGIYLGASRFFERPRPAQSAIEAASASSRG